MKAKWMPPGDIGGGLRPNSAVINYQRKDNKENMKTKKESNTNNG